MDNFTTQLKKYSDCCHLYLLPNEVLTIIFGSPILNYVDLCNLSCCSRKLRVVCGSADLWRNKFQQRWKCAFFLMDSKRTTNWKEKYREFHELCSTLHAMVDALSPQNYRKEEVSQTGFNDLLGLLEKSDAMAAVVEEELRSIFHLKRDGELLWFQNLHNLTKKYYGDKALRFVCHHRLRKTWTNYLSRHPVEQSLGEGAVLIAEWFQPKFDFKQIDVSGQLDRLADKVLEELKRRFPQHPACACKKFFSLPSENQWLPAHCRVILECINYVLYEQHQFKGNSDEYYDAKNSFINRVLDVDHHRGIPITLCILYASIASRLGVVCEPINFPAHFLLRWKEHPELTDGQEYTYIDAFRKGRFMPQQDCVRTLDIRNILDETFYSAIPPTEVLRRMIRNLINVGRQQSQVGDGLLCLRNALELNAILNEDDIDSRLLLARLYCHLGINFREVINDMRRITALHPGDGDMLVQMIERNAQKMIEMEEKEVLKPLTAKLKSKHSEVKYAVGLVMQHKRYFYPCVIYGWDPICEASQQWIHQMGVHKLQDQEKQPFYNVLADDGSNRYAAQENLIFPKQTSTPFTGINHSEVGRHFCEYDHERGCYVGNAEKQREYPEDLSAAEEIMRNSVGQHIKPAEVSGTHPRVYTPASM